ncbi:unnamed protein product [Lupinus luteus]|uniref:PUM-HD domain-containing protein n=1 Tax=Lupinus luteus TaxID=3873 RepID=A0AAV1WL55_LUPLU
MIVTVCNCYCCFFAAVLMVCNCSSVSVIVAVMNEFFCDRRPLSISNAYDDDEFQRIVDIFVPSFSTRVVQKLIETVKTCLQISLFVSALEPGFLTLIKDLSGNHVVQHCLQWLSNEDNKFIFVAAAKYCVDIATHQHGCCVLQRCIGHSSGKHREKLVAEICANALLLGQDHFG